MEMKDEFLFKTHMLDKNGEKKGIQQIADYMFRADMIYRMKLASDMGLPVLTLIARELEEKFDVFLAENGEEGLELLSEHYRELSVVLLDIQMHYIVRMSEGSPSLSWISWGMSRRQGVSGFRRCQSRDIFRQVRYTRNRKKEAIILK
jgi:CheY-like chemotaxis protein